MATGAQTETRGKAFGSAKVVELFAINAHERRRGKTEGVRHLFGRLGKTRKLAQEAGDRPRLLLAIDFPRACPLLTLKEVLIEPGNLHRCWRLKWIGSSAPPPKVVQPRRLRHALFTCLSKEERE